MDAAERKYTSGGAGTNTAVMYAMGEWSCALQYIDSPQLKEDRNVGVTAHGG